MKTTSILAIYGQSIVKLRLWMSQLTSKVNSTIIRKSYTAADPKSTDSLPIQLYRDVVEASYRCFLDLSEIVKVCEDIQRYFFAVRSGRDRSL